jgi:hypothetical protein
LHASTGSHGLAAYRHCWVPLQLAVLFASTPAVTASATTVVLPTPLHTGPALVPPHLEVEQDGESWPPHLPVHKGVITPPAAE